MPGAYASNKYLLQSVYNGNPPPDGTYKGCMVEECTLRLFFGGESFHGTLINPSFTDFKIKADDQYHDEYKKGLERGYKGKRKCSQNYLYSQSDVWREGYESGLDARLKYNASLSVVP